jgi:hypothetical protein
VIRRLIRANGTTQELTGPHAMSDLHLLLGADALDTVVLRHLGEPRQVMLLDDLGHNKGLPVNVEATKLYHANCRPGTTHQILGDVVVVPDDDFATRQIKQVPLNPAAAWPFPDHAKAVDTEGGEAS